MKAHPSLNKLIALTGALVYLARQAKAVLIFPRIQP